MTITISLSDEELLQLRKSAERLGVSVEELASKIIRKATATGDVDENSAEFDSILDDIMKDNADLYRRLA